MDKVSISYVPVDCKFLLGYMYSVGSNGKKELHLCVRACVCVYVQLYMSIIMFGIL